MTTKRRLLPGTLAAAALAGVLSLAGRGAAEEGIAWRTDLDAARREAAESGRPLCVVFR